jgi:hypothetical protein
MQSSSPFDRALLRFRNALDPKEEEAFRFCGLQDLQSALVDIQAQQAKSRKIVNLNRLRPFLKTMEQYGGVVETFLNVSSVLAFVWVGRIMDINEKNSLIAYIHEIGANKILTLGKICLETLNYIYHKNLDVELDDPRPRARIRHPPRCLRANCEKYPTLREV